MMRRFYLEEISAGRRSSAKHREFWKNKDPQLSMSGASGAAGT